MDARMLNALWALWLLAALLPAQAQEVYYIHTDALGSLVAETDANRNVVARFEYEPYGKRIGPGNDDKPGYTGHVMDAITGLVQMQQRYYDPEIGVFLSVDPVTAFSNPVGQFHRYRYANNNPYRFIDPDGRVSDEPERQPKPDRSSMKSRPSLASSVRTMDVNPSGSSKISSSISGQDGKPLTNPTGGGIRNDAGGQGHFGARRGTRRHGGLDLDSIDGQTVVSPTSGTAVNMRGATTGVPMVDITPSDKSTIQLVRLLYVEAGPGRSLGVPYPVLASDPVGSSVNLQSLGYGPAVGPHVHLQILVDGQWVDPAPYLQLP